MSTYTLSHLSDPALGRELAERVSRDRANLAELLAYIGEFDERRLYLPAAYPSMFMYCVSELHFSEDMAYKRIQAARAARRFPQIFAVLADGRLHLTGVVRLAPHLTNGNVDELLREAFWKTRAEIDHILARRFPGA